MAANDHKRHALLLVCECLHLTSTIVQLRYPDSTRFSDIMKTVKFSIVFHKHVLSLG